MELCDITQCRVCHGYNLSEGNILLEDIISGQYKLTNVKLCSDCDTIHYFKNDSLYYEFNINITTGITEKNVVQVIKENNGR